MTLQEVMGLVATTGRQAREDVAGYFKPTTDLFNPNAIDPNVYRNIDQQPYTAQEQAQARQYGAIRKLPITNKEILGRALMGGAGFADFTPIAGTFAGVKALTANKKLMDKAISMLNKGIDRAKVWKDTGWFKDIDGKMKFEIDDRGSGFIDEGYKKFRRKREGSSMPIEDVFEHKKLDKAYPKSKTDYETYWDDPSNWGKTPDDDMGFMDTTLFRGDSYSGGGSASPVGFDSVTLNTGWGGPKTDMPSMRSTLLHELQHGIQGREGFGAGGSPEMFSRGGKLFKKIPESIKKKVRKMTRQYEKLEGGSPERGKLVDKLYAMKDKYEPYGKYKRLLGEAEARNVQNRMDFSPQRRRATPPWETLDVPESEIRFLTQDKLLKTIGRRSPRKLR